MRINYPKLRNMTRARSLSVFIAFKGTSFFIFYFVWFGFLLNVLVNNFSVMLGQSHGFLGIYQYFGELKVSCSRTLHGDPGICFCYYCSWSYAV